MEVTIPCSDDFRHPEGTIYRIRSLDPLFQLDSASRYPARSPYRCFHCRMGFDTVPLFIIRSVMPQGDSGMLLVEIAGNYCCTACRTAALDNSRDVQRENHRMNIFRVDRIMFPFAEFDYTVAMPMHFMLAPFGGEVSDDEWQGIRERTAVRVLPFMANIKIVNETRGVKETYFGAQEGGIGEERVMEKLLGSSSTEVQLDKITLPDNLIYRNRILKQWPESSPHLCWWCACSFSTPPALMVVHRDSLGTITLGGNFCNVACKMAYLILEDSQRTMPHLSQERIGLSISLAVNTLHYPYRTRMSMAPHWQETEPFGGDLCREEFLVQCSIEDMITALERPPFFTARAPPNYVRPGLVCDLSKLGESTFEMQRVVVEHAHPPERKALFDLLLRETKDGK
jgi:hypothetical protein